MTHNFEYRGGCFVFLSILVTFIMAVVWIVKQSFSVWWLCVPIPAAIVFEFAIAIALITIVHLWWRRKDAHLSSLD